jgi:hypothetical protein
MRYSLDPAVIEEIDTAAAYYESRRPELGEEFLSEFRLTLALILENPRRFAILVRPTRRAKLHRFPYGIVYSVRGGAVIVLAVMQLQRQPGYWKDRM